MGHPKINPKELVVFVKEVIENSHDNQTLVKKLVIKRKSWIQATFQHVILRTHIITYHFLTLFFQVCQTHMSLCLISYYNLATIVTNYFIEFKAFTKKDHPNMVVFGRG
jgi:hypothetical protein